MFAKKIDHYGGTKHRTRKLVGSVSTIRGEDF